MAFKGDLKNISLFDVLQTLHQNQQTGVLVVQREQVTKKFYIDEYGVRVFFTRSQRPLRLGEIFVRRGRISPQDVEILLLQQKQTYRPMGALLIESGKVSSEEVNQVLLYHAEDEIYDVFSWEDGTFSFYDGQTVDEHSTQLSEVIADPAGLCLEAARRLDEMERRRKIIPDNNSYFIQVDGIEPDREQNSDAVCYTFDALAHPYSLNELRDLVGLSLYEALGTVGQLLEGGLVRPLSVEELVDAARQAREATEYDRSAEMFEKAQVLDPENTEVLEECIEAVQRLDEPKRLAGHLANLGQIHLAAGRFEESIELLEQAARLDSDDHDVLVALRDAFAGLGDAERTAEVSLKMARTFADEGKLDQAIESCAVGLQAAPQSIALRYQVSLLCARADRVEEAQHELYVLVDELEASTQAMRSRKAHDLLMSCYRLLLKMNPQDERAHRDMRNLDRRRMSSERQRKMIMQGGIAAAVLVLIGVVGLMLSGSDADALLEDVRHAYERGDLQEVRNLVADLVESYPDSEELQAALALRGELEERVKTTEGAKRKREQKVRMEFGEAWEEVRVALTDRPYLEALSLVEPYLRSLSRPEAAFLRPSLQANFEYEFSAFADNVLKTLNTDRQNVAAAEHKLRKQSYSGDALRDLETKLGTIRRRGWPKLVPQMKVQLQKIAGSRNIGKANFAIERLDKGLAGAADAFDGLDPLYFTVRSKRLRHEIVEAVNAARENRLDLLQRCKFAEARELYHKAFTKADAVTDEEPREHFVTLIRWLDKSHTRADMKEKRDEIDEVVATLKKVEDLKKAGDVAAAYRLFRPLVHEYPVIQFEKQYKIPFMVKSTPSGAEVEVNGKRLGVTPTAVDLEIIKENRIVVKRKGFATGVEVLHATDPKLTGELVLALRKETLWHKTINGRVEARPVMAAVGDRELLLIATSNANLLAYGVNDGEFKWEARTGLLDGIEAAPVVDDGHAYLVTVGGLLHRVRLSDGEIGNDKLRLPGEVDRDAAFDGSILYLATRNRHLVAVRGTKVVYDKPLALSPSTRLLYVDGRLYVGTAEGVILVHEAKSGREVMRIEAKGDPSFLGGIEAHENLVVAGAEDGALYAFDRASGRLAWKYATAGPVTAPPLSHGERIYLPTRDGSVHAITSQSATGRGTVTRYELPGSADRAPAIINEFLYAVGGGRLTAFDTADEVPWWEFAFEGADGDAERVVAGFGVVVVITSRSTVVAFPQDRR